MLSLSINYDNDGQWGQFVDIEYKEELKQIIIHQESSSLHMKTEKHDDDDFNNILLGFGTIFLFIGYIRNYIS
jgi:hypothetical protein